MATSDVDPCFRTMRNEAPLTSSEYHRRRAEAEMERALCGQKLSIAVLHLELAKRHRERCLELAAERNIRAPLQSGFIFNGTDKES